MQPSDPNDEPGWLKGEPLRLAVLKGETCEIFADDYDDDEQPRDYHVAVANLQACDFSVLQAVEQDIFHYYEDIRVACGPDAQGLPDIATPHDVWNHVQFGGEIYLRRSRHIVYASLECNCDWEPEHGLQIVFRNGERVVKVGPYDGHLTNAQAYGDSSLEDVIYRRL